MARVSYFIIALLLMAGSADAATVIGQPKFTAYSTNRQAEINLRTVSAGKAGGQTLNGGTAAGETLTVKSTSHATKGKILLGTSAYDEVNNRLGIGTASPSQSLHIEKSASSAGALQFLVKNTHANGDARFALSNSTGGAFIAQATGTGYAVPRLGVLATDGDMVELRFVTNGELLNTGTTPITFFAGGYVSTQETMRIVPKGSSGSGKVGIGTTSPTAVLHLKAGTATANTAPLKLTSGTDLTTAEAGAVEYDGTNLHFTAVGTLRENIMFGAKSNGTLTAGTATTITHANAKTTSTILLQSTSAAFSPLGAYISAKNNGTFVITHTIATGAETFDFILIN